MRTITHWPDIVISPGGQGGQQNLYMLPDSTECDLWEFEDKLDEAARLTVRAGIEPEALDRAAALRQDAILFYGGEFCKGKATGAIMGAAGYLHHRYLQAVMSQAAYWKDKAMKLCNARQRTGNRGGLTAEEENAWLEALKNYSLAVHTEPYKESSHAGVEMCRARLGQCRRLTKRRGISSRV